MSNAATTAEQLLPASRAAEILGISRQWLHMLVQQDRIEAVRLGRHMYLYRDVVLAYKKEKGEGDA